MLRKDFIMVQIEELGKVIATLISNRNNGVARSSQDLVQTVYSSLCIDRGRLMQTSPQDIHDLLNGDDGCGLQRIEIAAKLLIEEAFIYPDQRNTLNSKARELLDYVHRHDTTFSLERMQLLNELSNS